MHFWVLTALPFLKILQDLFYVSNLETRGLKVTTIKVIYQKLINVLTHKHII